MWRTVVLLAGVSIVVLVVVVAPVKEIVTVEDAITGTQARQSVWFGSVSSDLVIRRPSELDRRLTERGISWTRSWQFRGSNRVSGVGVFWSCALGADLPVESLTSEFVARATDEELRAFVRDMQSATEIEQHAIVDAANNVGVIQDHAAGSGG